MARCCCSAALDLELPYCAKWLLLAAFLASRNSHATDRRLFDLTARSRQRGGLQAHRKHVSCCMRNERAGCGVSTVGQRGDVHGMILWAGLGHAVAELQWGTSCCTPADAMLGPV